MKVSRPSVNTWPRENKYARTFLASNLHANERKKKKELKKQKSVTASMLFTVKDSQLHCSETVDLT